MAKSNGYPDTPTVRELRAALTSHGGHVTLTAAFLAVSRATLTRWISDHRLQPFASRLRAASGIRGPRTEGT